MESRRQSSEVQQSSPTKVLLVSSNGSPIYQQPARLNPSQKSADDAQTKQLRAQLEQFVGATRDKERKVERLTEQNNRLNQDNSQLEKQSEELRHELQEAKKVHEHSSSGEPQEEQKAQEEDLEQMKEFMMAIKMQSQGLAVVNGLTPEAIEMIPTFSYERTTEPEICLSCFQELQDNSNVKCLPCCHLFHEPCIREHLGQSRYCPACSEEVVLV